jgi:hypothetical protein
MSRVTEMQHRKILSKFETAQNHGDTLFFHFQVLIGLMMFSTRLGRKK